MDYEAMWNYLKTYIEQDRDYYHSGIMCSIGEAVHGEHVCNEILSVMNTIEEREKEGIL